jgi:hypothetical protein
MMIRSQILRPWVMCTVAALPFIAMPGRAQDSAGPPIPAAHGTALTGTAIALPDALKGKVGVLVLGFSHASQGQVSDWGRLITADYGQNQSVEYFEIPMLGGAPKMVRGMIVKSMGKSVPAAEKPHFLPLTEDDKPWRAVAHYDKADDAYVLLADGEGVVRWRTQGGATDAAWAGLKRELNGLLAGAGTH